MTQKLAALAMLPLFVVACGSARTVSAPPAAPASTPFEGRAEATSAATSEATPAEAPVATLETPAALRAPGDYVVFRFSGKLEKHPVTLTERLVSQQDDVTVIDYTVEDATSRRTMRARMVGAGTEQRVASTALLDGQIEGPVPTSTLDAFLASTLVPVEETSAAERAEHAVYKVGERAIDCTRTTYKVKVGKKDATMSVLASETFAWGDVGGEIRGADGTLLYKAELVGEGNAQSGAVAASE